MLTNREQEDTSQFGLGDSEEEYNEEEFPNVVDTDEEADENEYEDYSAESQDEEETEEDYQPAPTAQARQPKARAKTTQQEETEPEITPVSISDFRQYIPADMEITEELVNDFNTKFVDNPGLAVLSLMKRVTDAQSERNFKQTQIASFMQQQAANKYAGIFRDSVFGPLVQETYTSLPPEQQTHPNAPDIAIMGAVLRRAQEVKGGLSQAFEEAAAKISGKRLVDGKSAQAPAPKKEIIPPSQRTTTGAELATAQPVRKIGTSKASSAEEKLSLLTGISPSRAKTLYAEIEED